MRLVEICVLFMAIGVNLNNCARILVAFPYNGKSHSIMLNAVLKELVDRGHQLDVITAFPLPPNTPNYTAIDISPGHNFWPDIIREFGLTSKTDMSSFSLLFYQKMFSFVGQTTTEYALKHRSVQRFLHTNNQQYDLILVEEFYQDAFLMLSHQFRAPIVSISTFGWNTYFDSMFGSFGAWAHVPHEDLDFPDTMTFWQRLQNVFFCLCVKYLRYFQYLPRQQALADQYFAHLPEPRPSVEELSRSVSVILQNSHAPMASIKPQVPGIVDVGGIHITPAKPLPKDLREFLDGATDGVIYFSFGTQITSKDIPAEQMSAILRVFNEFSNIRVLWKFDSDNVDHIPSNVLTRKWLPQNDILAHPNVKLFITHGGLLGSQEGLYHGVPMLCIPFYKDQHVNANRAAMQGYGLKLDFKNITVDSLRWAIAQLLHDPKYARKAEEYSSVFRERPRTPMETAMFWIEYVIKFRGADHLRSAGRDLTWYSYLLLDVVAATILFGLVAIIVIWYGIRRLLDTIRVWRSSPNKFDEKYE